MATTQPSTPAMLPRLLRLLRLGLLGVPLEPTARHGSAVADPVSARLGAWWARHTRLMHAFVLIALCWIVAYLVWRIGFSLAGASPWLWAMLLAAELYGLWNLSMLAWMAWDTRSEAASRGPRSAPVQTDALSVDVYVCTYDEPLHVLEATLAGCALLNREHTTYVLDDGGRPEVAELASRWDASWITRPDNAHAKAGNINHALPRTDGDLVLALDADHVPMPDALETLIAQFADQSVALVQSPHDFSNHDSVQHYGFGRHEQSLFFSVICPGKDRHGAAFWCGSGALIRREALLQIGGVATETIAEDFHTTIKLHRAGWQTRYVPTTVVQGRAPHDLAAYLLQRDRWARGNLAVFTTPESPLRARELTVAQRLSYLASLTGYLSGPVRLLLLATLVAVLFTGALPLAIDPVAIALLWAPATLLGILAGGALCRGLQSAAESSHYELCTAEIFTRALRCVVRPGRTRFKVTPKEGVDPGGWHALRQFHIVLSISVLLLAALVMRIADDLGAGLLPAMHGFASWFVPLLGAIELRRMLRTVALVASHRQLRSEYRCPLNGSAAILTGANEQRDALIAALSDISPTGIGFELAEPLAEGTRARLLTRLPSTAAGSGARIDLEIEARSCHELQGRWRIGATIADCSAEDARRVLEYCHVIWPYARLRGRSALSSAPSRARITATASGLSSIST